MYYVAQEFSLPFEQVVQFPSLILMKFALMKETKLIVEFCFPNLKSVAPTPLILILSSKLTFYEVVFVALPSCSPRKLVLEKSRISMAFVKKLGYMRGGTKFALAASVKHPIIAIKPLTILIIIF